jgi:hypothetical protein
MPTMSVAARANVWPRPTPITPTRIFFGFLDRERLGLFAMFQSLVQRDSTPRAR